MVIIITNLYNMFMVITIVNQGFLISQPMVITTINLYNMFYSDYYCKSGLSISQPKVITIINQGFLISQSMVITIINQDVLTSSQSRLRQRGFKCSNVKQEIDLVSTVALAEGVTWMRDISVDLLKSVLTWGSDIEKALEECGINVKISEQSKLCVHSNETIQLLCPILKSTLSRFHTLVLRLKSQVIHNHNHKFCLGLGWELGFQKYFLAISTSKKVRLCKKQGK